MIFRYLLIAFIVIPLIELAILIKVGEIIGTIPTIGLVIVTGVLGASLAKQQGMMVWRKIQIDFQQARMPQEKLIDGMFVLIGGALLLTPGILTDIIGFSFLIPQTREIEKKYVKKLIKKRLNRAEIYFSEQ